MAYIQVSCDLQSAINQVDSSEYGELLNAIGHNLPGSGESDTVKAIEMFERYVGDELDTAGKFFLKVCAEYFDREFPGER